MNKLELMALVDRLRSEPSESEWLEFKGSNYDPQIIGEYFSALANSACIGGKALGYLVFGIEDATHEVVGTDFDPYTTKGKGNQDLLIWLSRGLQPNTGFETHIVDYPDGLVVLFEMARHEGNRFDSMVRLMFALVQAKLSLQDIPKRRGLSGHAESTGRPKSVNALPRLIWTQKRFLRPGSSSRSSIQDKPRMWTLGVTAPFSIRPS